MLDVCTTVPGVAWPGIPGPFVSQLLAMQSQFRDSQWLAPDELLRRQTRQLGKLLAHAYDTAPFYRRRLDAAELPPSRIQGAEQWARIPLLTRGDIQSAHAELLSTGVPDEHGPHSTLFTSGSTGKPVMIVATGVTQLFWNACTLRDHLWHRRLEGASLAAIRSVTGDGAKPPDGTAFEDWGPAIRGIVQTGPAFTLSIHSTTNQQAQWLQRCSPDYLLSYPSNILALIQHSRRNSWRPTQLKEVRTFGELLEPHVRDAVRAEWGVKIVDMYSSQEVGYIALQCPDSENYHVQSESILLEVLDEHDRACEPGAIGRIVVTPLHNFAMPLLRYEIGDYAEVGGRCPCGRGLPMLKRIVGRQRNMVVLPNGDRRWPAVELAETKDLQEFPPIQQFQLVQRTLTRMEMSLVTPRPLQHEEESRLRGWIETAVGHRFDVAFLYVDEIPRSPSGKFEEFRCEVNSNDDAQ